MKIVRIIVFSELKFCIVCCRDFLLFWRLRLLGMVIYVIVIEIISGGIWMLNFYCYLRCLVMKFFSVVFIDELILYMRLV